jgi:hypothetical protein
MKHGYLIFLLLVANLAIAQKPRLIVTTDIGQDPDDQQSMVRLLHYANEIEMEGLIANADANYKHEAPIIKDSIIHLLIDKYSEILPALRKHDASFPAAADIRRVVKRGYAGNSEAIPYDNFIGEGKDTQGSDWIITVVDRADPRPVHVAVWGGACDLAQALWKVKQTRSAQEVTKFVSKLRVFFIGKQDSSNQWIIDTFPDLWLVLALDRGGDKWQSSYRGMFWGGDMSNTTKSWLHENIISQNPLAAYYPDQAYTGGEGKNPHMAMKEGDSPSFLFFLQNGLNQPERPEWGGWGGRYVQERDHLYLDANDSYYDEQSEKVINSPRATVFRWRPDFQNDFMARVQWGISSYEEANHHPSVQVNGSSGTGALLIQARPGEKVTLDATQSGDPDGDEISCEWEYYPEAGTYSGEFQPETSGKVLTFDIPEDAGDSDVVEIGFASFPLSAEEACTASLLISSGI